MQDINIESYNALNGPVLNASICPVGQDGLAHKIAEKAVQEPAEPPRRQWSRQQAAYWLISARRTRSWVRRFGNGSNGRMLDLLVYELRLYAKYKAMAER